MAILSFEFEEIEKLLAIVEANMLHELIVEENDRSLRISGIAPTVSVSPQSSALETANSQPAAASTQPPGIVPRKAITTGKLPHGNPPNSLSENEVALTSPMMGMFYCSEKPGSPPLIVVGQDITAGQTIGLIEAMKIFSEVPAEESGTVVAIPVKDGQLVHSGTPLIILRKR